MQSPFASRRALKSAALAVVLVAGGFMAASATSSSASGKGSEEVRMLDECDPATFNAAGISCVGHGDVTFPELLKTLTPAIGGHEDWKFKPSTLKVKTGTSLHVVNRGGEDHTFTEVSAFGAGFVLPLNGALPPGTPLAIVVGSTDPIPAGGGITISGLAPGVHMFQCMIHPWMRTTITVGKS